MDVGTATSIWTSLGDLADDDIYFLYDDDPFCDPEADGFDLESIVNQRLDWKPVNDPNLATARVVLNQGRTEAWENAQMEIGFVREQLATNFGFDEDCSMERELKKKMFGYFFGSESEIFIELKRHLVDLSHQHFLKVLYAFLYSCCHGGLSTKDMYDERSELMRNVRFERQSRVPSQTEYQQFWKRVGTSKRAGKYLWMYLEDHLNSMLQELFVASWDNGDMNVVIDDDKAHFETTKRDSSADLKVMKHARDNRNGFTNHHLVLPYSQTLIGATWEGVRDTTYSCTKRLVEATVCPAHRGDSIPPLPNLRLNHDRGYNNKQWIFRFLEAGGRLVVAMAQRNRMYPFTYDQLLKLGDSRILLSTKGPRSLHVMEADTDSGQKLYFFAYVNGTSSVAMAVSTIYTRLTFDLVLKNEKDSSLHRQSLTEVDPEDLDLDESFSSVESSDDDFDLLLYETESSSDESQSSSDDSSSSSDESQSSSDESSSSSDDSISKMSQISTSSSSKYNCQREDSRHNSIARSSSSTHSEDDTYSQDDCQQQDTDHNPMSETTLNNWKLRAFKDLQATQNVVSNTEDKQLLAQLKIEPVTTRQNSCEWHLGRMFSLTSSGSDRAIALYKGDEEGMSKKAWQVVKDYKSRYKPQRRMPANPNEDDDPIPDNILQTVARLCSPQGGDAAAATMKEEIQNGTMESNQIELYLRALGAKVSAGQTRNRTNKNTLLTYLDSGDRNRYSIMTKSNLEKELSKATNKLQIRLKKKPATRPELIKILLDIDNNCVDASNVSANTLLGVIMQSSFMPRLTGTNLEYCRLGHQLEGPLARDILQLSAANKTYFRIDRIYEAGLIAKEGRPFVKDSADLVGSAFVKGKQIVHPIELKSRVASKTLSKERQRQRQAMFQTGSTSNSKFCHVAATSTQLGSYLQCAHEAIQCLHHAYCYDSEYVLFVVGNRKGKVESGIWIHFSEQLREAYGRVLTDLYVAGLRWAYEPEYPMPTDCQVEAEIKANPKLKLDVHTWHQWVQIFKSIMNDIGYPLPPTERIIPLIFSSWNAGKSGSDTISKLLAKCHYNIPSQHAQAEAVARMIQTITVVCLRSCQIAGAKPDLSYPSLKHFRNAASQRLTHSHFLRDLLEIIEEELNVRYSGSSGAATTVTTPSNSVARNTRRRRRANESHSVSRSTGNTPKRRVLQIYQNLPQPVDLSTAFCSATLAACYARMRRCTGCPVYRYCTDYDGSPDFDEHTKIKGPGARGTCVICATTTNWWCRGCHHWFCVGNKKNSEMSVLKVRDNKGVIAETVKIRLDCFAIGHETGMKLFFDP